MSEGLGSAVEIKMARAVRDPLGVVRGKLRVRWANALNLCMEWYRKGRMLENLLNGTPSMLWWWSGRRIPVPINFALCGCHRSSYILLTWVSNSFAAGGISGKRYLCGGQTFGIMLDSDVGRGINFGKGINDPRVVLWKIANQGESKQLPCVRMVDATH